MFVILLKRTASGSSGFFIRGMPDHEVTTIGEGIEDVLSVLVPEYDELVQEKNAKLGEEQKHFTGAIRYLKARHAPREEYDHLYEERRKELRRIQEEFSAKVKELVRAGIKRERI